LEVYCHCDIESTVNEQWISIPINLETEYLHTLQELKLKTTGSQNKYVLKLFHWF
jgi:hypothetical protein